MKKLLIASSLFAVAIAATNVCAQTTPAAAATSSAATPYYSTEETPLGDLLDNPDTKAVLEKHIPQVINNDQIDQARGMTLKAIQPYAGETLTDKILAEIDADLKDVPAPK
jgi:hypothetical protein